MQLRKANAFKSVPDFIQQNGLIEIGLAPIACGEALSKKAKENIPEGTNTNDFVRLELENKIYLVSKKMISYCMVDGSNACQELQTIFDVKLNPKTMTAEEARNFLTEGFLLSLWKSRPELYQLMVIYDKNLVKNKELSYPISFPTGTVFYNYELLKTLIEMDLVDYTIFNDYWNLRNDITTSNPLRYSYIDQNETNVTLDLYSKELVQLRIADNRTFSSCLNPRPDQDDIKSYSNIIIDGKITYLNNLCATSEATRIATILYYNEKDYDALTNQINKMKAEIDGMLKNQE